MSAQHTAGGTFARDAVPLVSSLKSALTLLQPEVLGHTVVNDKVRKRFIRDIGPYLREVTSFFRVVLLGEINFDMADWYSFGEIYIDSIQYTENKNEYSGRLRLNSISYNFNIVFTDNDLLITKWYTDYILYYSRKVIDYVENRRKHKR